MSVYTGIFYCYNNKLISGEYDMENFYLHKTIHQFINEMEYMNNPRVIGCILYGSYLTGYQNKDSDIDLRIILNNNNPNLLIRGNKMVNGKRIEYFEKPIADEYLSIDNGYLNQDNAMFSIIGNGEIIFDKTGEVKELQRYAIAKFSKPLPSLNEDDTKEYMSILDNRLLKLKIAYEKNDPFFNNLYYLTIEKIRKFYHRINGIPSIQTSKVYRVYTDPSYAESMNKIVPSKEFIDIYFDCILGEYSDKKVMYLKVLNLYEYVKNGRDLGGDYRILIRSRNDNFRGTK